MIDHEALFYGPLYDRLGVAAVLTPVAGSIGPQTVTVIDQTAGIEIDGAGGLGLPVIKPAAAIRASSLATIGIAAADLNDGTINLAGQDWIIDNIQPRPGPAGKASGEYLLILKAQA